VISHIAGTKGALCIRNSRDSVIQSIAVRGRIGQRQFDGHAIERDYAILLNGAARNRSA